MIQPIVLPRPSIFHFAEAQPGTESYESVRCSPRVRSWASASVSLSAVVVVVVIVVVVQARAPPGQSQPTSKRNRFPNRLEMIACRNAPRGDDRVRRWSNSQCACPSSRRPSPPACSGSAAPATVTFPRSIQRAHRTPCRPAWETCSYQSVMTSPGGGVVPLHLFRGGRSIAREGTTTTPHHHPLLLGPINCPYLARVVRPL